MTNAELAVTLGLSRPECVPNLSVAIRGLVNVEFEKLASS